MAKNDVKLIGARHCPFVLRARIALNVKSVEYEFLEETLENKSELLLKYKKIPVLIHNDNSIFESLVIDKPICESLIIVEYIDEAWASGLSILPSHPSDRTIVASGPSIPPSVPYDRAIARFWAAYIDEKWFPTLKDMANAADKKTGKTATGQVEEGLGLLEEAFQKIRKGKSFFGGDHIGYLDIAFGGLLGCLRWTEERDEVKLINETKTPGFLKWADKFVADPAVKDVFPDIEGFRRFLKTN